VNTQERIAKLEQLLNTVRSRAAEPEQLKTFVFVDEAQQASAPSEPERLFAPRVQPPSSDEPKTRNAGVSGQGSTE